MVAMDSRNRRDGAAIEELGWYNPIDSNHSYDLKDERILHWLGEGAQPTDAAKKLLRRAGLSHRWHLMQQGMDGSDLEKEMKKWELNREDVLKKRAEKQEQKAKVVAKKNEVEAVETVKNDSGDASSNDEGPNEDQLGENIPEQPEGSDKDESSQEEE
jgi:small subunit ribosomal protein S16|tara:strand:+ start:476 stop:949 length:474 start_codon:yes stop_codon:yes gene_type:complete